MGFVTKLLGFGSPNSEFQAQPAQLAQTDYGSAINAAMNNGLMPDQTIADVGNSNQTRGQQDSFVQALMSQLSGAQPSVAQQQLNQATEQNIKQGAGLAASQKGINPALLARQILQGTAAANQQAVGQGALLRANEQNQLYNTLSQALAQKRQQDLGQSELAVNAGLNTLNANTQRLGAAGGLQNQQNATNVQNSLGTQQINAGTASENAKNATGFLSGILNAGAGIAGSLIGANKKYDGGVIPGDAEVSGDHPANDTVPAMLSPGEIVIPRTAATSSGKAKAFIDEIMKEKKEDDAPSYADVVQVQRHLNKRLMDIEKMCYGGRVK